MLKGGQAIIGGKIENIGDKELSELSVELELRARKSGSTEMRTVNVEPKNLAPGDQGSYSLTVSNREWSNVRIRRIRSAGHDEEVAFKSEVGQRRPPERIPENKKVIVVSPPRQKGDEFINTPDTAVAVP